MRYSKIITTLLTLSAATAPLVAHSSLSAQTTTAAGSDSTRVAGIVAVVGDSIITSAFVADATAQRMQMLQQRKLPVPTTTEAFKALQDTVIDERIEELVILQTIARDTSYKVSEDNVNTVVEARFNQVQTAQGGPIPFARALKESGLTAQEYKNLIASQVRTEELFKQFRARMADKRQPPKATEKEILELFPAWQQAQGPRPALVGFQQLVVHVTPSDTALARAKAKADSIFLVLIKDREAFPEMAKRLSDDKASGADGGEIGWFKESADMVREFVKASFAVPAGTLIPPVKTEFGYHIIEVERRRGSEVQVRHILISPTITEADIARAKARADSAADKLRAGADIQELVKQYGNPNDELTVAAANPADLKTNGIIDLTTAKKGDIVGPSATAPGPGQRFTIARVTETSPAGEWTINDPGVRDTIRFRVEQQKLLDEVVSELRRKMYIEIRPH